MRRRPLRAALVIVIACGIGSAVGSGCGGENDQAAVEERVARERVDAAAQAKQEQRIKDLADEVRTLKKERKRPASTAVERQAPASPAVTSSSSSGDEATTFHTPSGNISCRVATTGALCTVASMETTFAIGSGGGGGAAQQRPGLDLPQGSGEARSYGESVSAGAFTCALPASSNSTRGVVCADRDTGHGFEASAKRSRQRAY